MNIQRFLTVSAVASMLWGGAAQPVHAAAPIRPQGLVYVVAYNDFYKALENTELAVKPGGVLLNDESYLQGARLNAELVARPQFGDVTLNADGSFVYVPLADFAGIDTFTYQARSGSITAEAVVLIEVAAPDPVLAANDDVYKAAAGAPLVVGMPGVLENDKSAASVTAEVVIYPKAGKLSLDANGGFVYIPPASFSGADTFVYSVTDGKRTSLATVTIYMIKASPIRILKPRK